jgi:hypothetical protein
MLARRVIALSVDKGFGKVIATALRAAGGVVELHADLAALGTGDLQAALVVVHLDGALASSLEELALRLRARRVPHRDLADHTPWRCRSTR